MLLLVVRGLPALVLYRRDLPRYQLLPLGLFSAAGLPLIVVITTIGVQEGRMRPVNAAALVAAGMLSVLLFPMFARMRLARGPTVPDQDRAGAAPGGRASSRAIAPATTGRPWRALVP